MLWQDYKKNLLVLLDRLKPPDAADTPEQAKIRALLEAESSAGSWVKLNEAELRLTALLPPEDVNAEFIRRGAEAQALIPPLPAVVPLQAAFAPAAAAERRALLLRLVQDLHLHYERRRLDRATRKAAANHLNNSGMAVIIVIFFGIGVLLCWNDAERVARFHPFFVVFAGIIGAYFSRLIDFQSRLRTLDYYTIQLDFAPSRLVSRATTGAIGALVLYWLIGSGLLGGGIFPEATMANLWKFVALDSGQTVGLPTVDFFKLMIWSVLAGFSERLVPTQLSALEVRAAGKPKENGR
ncbi:hypothetical protein DKG75_07205 [Zavarzinia compransoris]|uniref:Uncharacterized protein n=1 Tax=Zavarzinia compransoris TaxID=1264899 RepID=A0A317E449_9PROT|nr:hypothetical protein DKG75_07205 [Zavarzinia compransoris]